MADLTTTNFDKMLKVWYEPGRVKLQAYKDNPLLALLPKDENFRGKNRTIPIWYRTGQGVSATFATAQANKSVGGYENFVLTRVKGYGLGSIQNEVLEAARGGDKASFLEATVEIDGVMHQTTRDLALSLYGTQNGQRGVIGAIENGDGTDDRITLASRCDVVNFEVGMSLVASTGGGSAGITPALFIGRIDRSNGYLFMVDSAGAAVDIDTTPATVWAIGDTLHREGDLTTGSQTLKTAGLAAWIPLTAPSSTAFFGVDRTEDDQRLAGVRAVGTGMSVEDGLIELATELRIAGAKPDIGVLNPLQIKKLTRELGSKVQYDIVKSPDMAKIGFEAFKLHTPAGVVKVIEDPNAPCDRAYMLTMSTWKFYSMGGAPRILTYGPGDGAKWLREADDDSVEFRAGFYGNMGCNAPGQNGVVSLDV
jgi:hypothetical protein